MNWQQGMDEYSATARTNFAELRIHWDMTNTSGLDHIRYTARVETINGTVLASEDNIILMADAKRWCVQAYAQLLRDELASID